MYPNLRSLVNHIGSGHGVLKKILDKDNPRQFFSTPAVDLKPWKRGSDHLTTLTTTTTDNKKIKAMYECKICEKVFKNFELKMKHLSELHYQQDRCRMCHAVVDDPKSQFEHLVKCYKDPDLIQ